MKRARERADLRRLKPERAEWFEAHKDARVCEVTIARLEAELAAFERGQGDCAKDHDRFIETRERAEQAEARVTKLEAGIEELIAYGMPAHIERGPDAPAEEDK
jgi:hypothetical protein